MSASATTIFVIGLVLGVLGWLKPFNGRDTRDLLAPCLEGKFECFSFSDPTSIPDNSANGVMIGPIPIPADGNTIGDVVLRIEIQHPYSGDLALKLYYDRDNDGTYDAFAVADLSRARADACLHEAHAECPVVLNGRYFVNVGSDRDRSRDLLAADRPFGTVLGQTAVDLQGLERGGSFYLNVVDHEPGDRGTVLSWAVGI